MQSVSDKSGFLASNISKNKTKKKACTVSLLCPHVVCSANSLTVFPSSQSLKALKIKASVWEHCLNITLLRTGNSNRKGSGIISSSFASQKRLVIHKKKIKLFPGSATCTSVLYNDACALLFKLQASKTGTVSENTQECGC